MLLQLRNLTEGLAVRAHEGTGAREFHYDKVAPALEYVRANAQFNLLGRFHSVLQASTSHYTFDGEQSERLMLKYYAYLLRVRELARNEFDLTILTNLEDFPVDLDPALSEYYAKIAEKITQMRDNPPGTPQLRDRYYVSSVRPVVTQSQVIYEVTFTAANDYVSKFDRMIGFSDRDLTDWYAANLELTHTQIEVFDRVMPVILVREWEVSIRPSEFEALVRLFGDVTSPVRADQSEYKFLMSYLTQFRANLLDLMRMSDARYSAIRSEALRRSKSDPRIFPALDQARRLIQREREGHVLLRYLLLKMRRSVLRSQWDLKECSGMSQLRASWSARPFDTMPFCTNPREHLARFADLSASQDASKRQHELLARRVRENVEQDGQIYTPRKDLEGFGDIDALIRKHNGRLPQGYPSHERRRLHADKGHVFIEGYENDTVDIIEKLRKIGEDGVAGYSATVEAWLARHPEAVDDEVKAQALTQLFDDSKVALIYGAAGTGKSTMVGHIADLFASKRKLFLAQTHPAVDNLRRRTAGENSTYRTIASHLKRDPSDGKWDVLVVDECSTVSNSSLLDILRRTSFELLVLVGDSYQIESIEFGNWFETIPSYISPNSVFELTEPHRTDDPGLLELWTNVRTLNDRIEESFAQGGYSRPLDGALFEKVHDDEIVLCLNYDGLYGINNVNRFLQSNNPASGTWWNDVLYKPGDPIVFNDSSRFRPIIFNNMKGWLVKVQEMDGRIDFEVRLERTVTTSEAVESGLRRINENTVGFSVDARKNDDEESDTTVVPFQIAYAVSIHRAQGLEYESVKVIITDASEDNISHSVFYTAITRARKSLQVFWSPEAQQRVLAGLSLRDHGRNESMLKARRGLRPSKQSPRGRTSRLNP